MNLNHGRTYESPWFCPLCGERISVYVGADEATMVDACTPPKETGAAFRHQLYGIMQSLELLVVEWGANQWYEEQVA